MGRPRVGPTETKLINFKADRTIDERLEKAASSLKLRKSDIIREAVMSWLNIFEKHCPGKSA